MTTKCCPILLGLNWENKYKCPDWTLWSDKYSHNMIHIQSWETNTQNLILFTQKIHVWRRICRCCLIIFLFFCWCHFYFITSSTEKISMCKISCESTSLVYKIQISAHFLQWAIIVKWRNIQVNILALCILINTHQPFNFSGKSFWEIKLRVGRITLPIMVLCIVLFVFMVIFSLKNYKMFSEVLFSLWIHASVLH